MYGAFCYQYDGDGYCCPSLMGIYGSIDAFDKDLPRLKELYGHQLIRNGGLIECVTIKTVLYPHTSEDPTSWNENFFSLEELIPNEIHKYKWQNDFSENDDFSEDDEDMED